MERDGRKEAQPHAQAGQALDLENILHLKLALCRTGCSRDQSPHTTFGALFHLCWKLLPGRLVGAKWKGCCSDHIRKLVPVLSVHTTGQELNPERWGACPWHFCSFSSNSDLLCATSVSKFVIVCHRWDPRFFCANMPPINLQSSIVPSAPDLSIFIPLKSPDPVPITD